MEVGWFWTFVFCFGAGIPWVGDGMGDCGRGEEGGVDMEGGWKKEVACFVGGWRDGRVLRSQRLGETQT